MSNTLSSSTATKPLLNDANWHVWSPLMRLTLMERGVWGHIDESDPKPPAPGDGATMSTELRKWNREENKAIAEILNGCEPGLRGKLMVNTATITSAGLWKKLETSFKEPGVGVMLTIRFGILTRFCPEGGSVQEHADLMVSENNKLVGSGLEFDDLTLAAQLLLTLPKSLQAIRQTFLTRPREQLTFENVKAALLAVDHTDRLAGLIRGENPVTPTEPSAMYNNGPFTSPRDTPKRPINGKWCDYHRSASHSNADCRQQQSSDSNTPSGKANTAQHKSGKPTKGNAKQNSANASSKEEQSDSDDAELMFVSLDSELDASALTATTNPASSTGQDSTVWMVDSAATLHFCSSNEGMIDYTPTSKLFVKVGDGRRLKIAGIGKIRALLQHKSSTPTPVTLQNVHHVPQLTVNLLSVACMDELGLTVTMGSGKCVIRNRQQRVIAEAHKDKTRHYRLTTRPLNTTPSAYSTSTSQAENNTPSGATRATKPGTIQLWHRRLGHASADALRLTFGNNLVTGVDCDAVSTSIRESAATGPLECDSCTIGKAARKPFKRATIRSKQPLQLIHIDLSGPFDKVRTHTGGRYIMVVVDDSSRFLWVKVLSTKDSTTVLAALQEYKAWAEARQHLHGHRLLAIRCDGGGEFHSNASTAWYAEHGIDVQKTAPHTSQTNGVAERMIRTLMDKVRTVLNASGMSAAFWPEAAKYAAHTINRLPSRPLGNRTPYEVWTGQKPDISHVRPFGCVAFRHIPAQDRHKLSDRARECAMVGYTGNKQAYFLWDPVAQRIVVSRDVDFREHRWWSNNASAGRGGPTDISADTLDTSNTSRTSPTPYNIPSTSDPNRYDDQDDQDDDNDDPVNNDGAGADEVNYDSDEDHEPLPHLIGPPSSHLPAPAHPPQSRALAELRDHLPSGPRDSPSVVQNSRLRPFPWHRDRGATWVNNGAYLTSTSEDDSKWRDSRQAEMNSLLKARTYSLVPRPAGVNVVGCKWVDKEKLLPDGSIKLKSRLVAQGFTQQPGIDFYETHSPTVRLDSLRGLLALAAHYDWHVHHMDVKAM
jgi:transposase InsO family protein